jgi:hypothetical protein
MLMRLRNPERALLVAGALVAGLTIRLYLLTSSGTQDVSFDVGWGHAINNAGFADYYNGNYFPLQYHVFQLAAWMSDRQSIGGPTALKT